MGNTARSFLTILANKMFIIVLCLVSNGKDLVLSAEQLQVSDTDVRQSEELVDFMDKNSGPKEPFILRLMFECILELAELDKEYMGFYTHGYIMNDPYMTSFPTTVGFQMLSSWNLDTM